MERYPIGILGATGIVGQRLVQRLDGHPWFELVAVAASDRSAGRSYRDATRWRLEGAPPAAAASRIVRPCRPEELAGCAAVLSALDATAGGELEPAFRDAGFAVVSNSSGLRMEPGVPLLVPEINAAHLDVLAERTAGGGGFVVTNPNCSVTGLALALAPLHRAFGVTRAVVATLQAVSGAGLDGPSALDLIDNVVPYIPGEEEKIERELAKILGVAEAGAIRAAPIVVSAHCHRVPVQDGHLEAVSVALERSASVAEVVQALREFRGETEALGLPSSCSPPIEIRSEPDRPQPRLDRGAAGGMAVVVGRVRPCPVLDFKLELLSHNTVRGAAGATLLNAELLAARGLLPGRGAA